MSRSWIVIGFLFVLPLVSCGDLAKDTPAKEITYLEQGWTPKLRQQFYYTNQGSLLIPYKWFLALEQPSNQGPFRADNHIEGLRYIVGKPDPEYNPDGLPVGFVKENDPEIIKLAYKRAFSEGKVAKEDHVKTDAWIGLTCAACHTGEIQHAGRRIRIDGGPTMADSATFLELMAESLTATTKQDAKMTRFAQQVLGSEYSKDQESALRNEVMKFTKGFIAMVKLNDSPHPYGFGRVDAFGAIMNDIAVIALGIPENRGIADAPVSYPFLWDTPKLDWVQWNGSINNPIGRNVGEALGVFARLNLTGPPADLFKSTANVKNLHLLEKWIDDLKSPRWPEEILGKLDPKKAKRGETLYMKNCVACHSVKDPKTDQYPMTTPNKYGKQFITIRMVRLAAIKTDPKMALNFAQRTAKTGNLAQFIPGNPKTAPAGDLIGIAAGGVIKRKFGEMSPPLTPKQLLDYTGYRVPPPEGPEPPNVLAYKAQPLSGIWATAPFLHNGSVPNLYQLLLPVDQRVKTFYVGSREFDPKNVGFKTKKFEGAFEFLTNVPGNSNSGHEYGTKLSDEERWDLIEYLKTL